MISRYSTGRVAILMMGGIIVIVLAMVLFSYSWHDPSWLYDDSFPRDYHNILGSFGAYVAGILIYFLGCTAYLLVPITVLFFLCWGRVLCWYYYYDRLIALGILMGTVSLACTLLNYDPLNNVMPGGVLGYVLHHSIKHYGVSFEQILVGSMLCIVGVLLFRFTWFSPVAFFMRKVHVDRVYTIIAARMLWVKKRIIPRTIEFQDDLELLVAEIVKERHVQPNESMPSVPEHSATEKLYKLPDISLLSQRVSATCERDRELLKKQAAVITEKLEHFGIYGKVTAMVEGPVVTLFKYQPRVDIKLSSIMARDHDVTLALRTTSLRIIAPLPGTAVIGFEVANSERHDVFFAECINSPICTDFSGTLPLVLGVDSMGVTRVVDLVTLPHLLIAGATGSGKSVMLHTLLMGILYRVIPQDVQFILIDPKRLELSQFADIPHLIFPVVIDVQKAIAALKWAVHTMEERYDAMTKEGVRTIQEFNARHKNQRLPLIVIVIDELADLIMTAQKDVEFLIIRLAQMARAAGIHLIAATQRPSVDVVTGLIKANFPSRIAFKVASKVDSRTILDTAGAEKLLGKGDMLYVNTQGILERIHGSYVSDEEIKAVTVFIKQQQDPKYEEFFLENHLNNHHRNEYEEFDEVLYRDICAFLDTVPEISISLIQRRFRIGYNRSARIIERLESDGRISAAGSGKTRHVVRTKEHVSRE